MRVLLYNGPKTSSPDGDARRPPSSTTQPSADASTMAALTDIKKLDAHMADNSYVEGYSATQKDVSVFQAISKPADSFPNALRWYEHIASFSAMKLAALPGTPEKLAAAASSSSSAPAPAAEKKEKAPKEKKEKPPKEEKAKEEKPKAADSHQPESKP